jgi:prepilin-type N-terminal cleavage/methylation domain-containing protein
MRRSYDVSRGRRGGGGFTLVEMLVTLMLAALLLSLVWQALGIAARVEFRLQASSASKDRDFMRREWVRMLVTTAVQDGSRNPFQAGPRSITFSSLEALSWQETPGGRIRLTLERPAGKAGVNVSVRPALAAVGGEPAEGLVLAYWPDHEDARFQFLDRQGQWLDEWPPPQETVGRLPRAVRVLFAGGFGDAWIAEIMSDEPPRIRRVDQERQ